jgi:phospholipid-binding lipoprotein MlaA
MNIRFIIKLALITIFALNNIVAIAAKKDDEDDYSYNYASLNNQCPVYDPYESLNRKIFFVNGVLDTFLLRPAAKGYHKLTNEYTRDRVGSVLSNITEPLSTVNYLIQGKGEGAMKSFWRFAINSTVGIGGLFDVASKIKLAAEPQTFGSTMARYGVASGPYIVLPIYGGMAARDVMDPIAMNSSLNPVKYFMHRDTKWIIAGTNMIHSRDKIMPFTDYVSKNSPDAYVAIRNAIISEKEAKMAYPEDFKCPTVNKK